MLGSGEPRYLHEVLVEGEEKTAVIFDKGYRTYNFSYSEVKGFSEGTMCALNGNHRADEGFIGVAVEQCEVFPSILLGILQTGKGFFCISPDTDFLEELTALQRLRVKRIFATQKYIDRFCNGLSFEEVHIKNMQVESSCGKLYLASLPEVINVASLGNKSNLLAPNLSQISMKPFEWAYAIKTSGTTGSARVVFVSHQAILTNVLDFIKRFSLNRQDVTFGAAPSTFDPHVVDVFMTLGCGGTLLYVPKSVKLSPSDLANMLIKHRVTNIHCTPSLFHRFGKVESVRVIRNPKLRILAFGGEPFPEIDFLRGIIPTDRQQYLSLYNLYGTTELSCWAAANLIKPQSDDEIGILQDLIPDTTVKLMENEFGEFEVLLGSKHRHCIVVKCETGDLVPANLIENGIIFRSTGDIVNRESFPLITYKGRTDTMMKRQGHFVDLNDLQQRMTSIPFLANAICFSDFGLIYVIVIFDLTFGSDLNKMRFELFDEIQRRVPIPSLPDHIIVVEPKEIPLTLNGKLDLKKLRKMVLQQNFSSVDPYKIPFPIDDVKSILIRAWNIYGGSDPTSVSCFSEAGGDSFRAMLMVEYVFQQLNLFGTKMQQRHSQEMLRTLIQSNFDAFFKFVQTTVLPVGHKVKISVPTDSNIQNRNTAEKIIKMEEALETRSIGNEGHTTFNLLGCVDATPILIHHPSLGKIIIATSNSGIVIVLKSESTFHYDEPEHHLIWWKRFPDRIVASVALSADSLCTFIPCCDGRLYTVETESGNLLWSFFTGALLRTTPLVCQKFGIVVAASDNDHMFGMELKSGELLWKINVPSLISTVNPLFISGIQEIKTDAFYVATKDGITQVGLQRGKILSTYFLQIICTNFVSEGESKMFCVGTRSIKCSENSIHLFRFSSNGELTKVWSQPTSMEINTPMFYSLPPHSPCTGFKILFVSKNGYLHILDSLDGKSISVVHLDTPVTSSPTIIDGSVAIISETEGKIFILPGMKNFKNFCEHDIEVIQINSLGNFHVLTNMVYDEHNLVFGGRDDRLHILNWHKAKRRSWLPSPNSEIS